MFHSTCPVIVGGLISLVLLADPGWTFGQERPPGVVIHHVGRDDRVSLHSPSLAILPDGGYLVSTLVRPLSTDQSSAGRPVSRTEFFRSDDQGQTWSAVSRLESFAWANLFVVGETLYAIGSDRRFGRLVIRRSADGGQTWTEPDEVSGVLGQESGYYVQPSPVLKWNGRIWLPIAQEHRGQYRNWVIHAPATADLLDPRSWSRSNAIALSKTAFGGENDRVLEGSVVPGPEGRLAVVYSVRANGGNRAAIATLTADGRQLRLRAGDMVEYSGGRNGSFIRQDPDSRQYVALANPSTKPFAIQNRLELIQSGDLRQWDRRYTVAYHHDGTWHALAMPAWHFEGADLIAVCQTAWDGAPSANRPNYVTFHRIKDFRQLDTSKSPPALGAPEAQEFETGSLRVRGYKIDVIDLQEGNSVNRHFRIPIQQVPARWEGWRLIRHVGGGALPLRVTGVQDGELTIAVPDTQFQVDVTGWKKMPDPLPFGNRGERLILFSRRIQRGQTIVLPSESWSGTLVLLPPES